MTLQPFKITWKKSIQRVIAFLPIVCAIMAIPSQSMAAEIDLARFAPINAGFYAEFENLDEIQRQFKNLDIWTSVRKYAEGESPNGERWQQQTESRLGMNTDELIERLFGHRAALFASSPASWQDGVIVCEFEDENVAPKLLKKWGVEPRPDSDNVETYQLGEKVRCAVYDKIMIVGPSEEGAGQWLAAVALLKNESKSHLAGRSDFAALRARLPENVEGFIFARWDATDKFAIADCERLMAGFKFDRDSTACTLVGHLRRRDQVHETLPEQLWSNRPDDEIAFWTADLRNQPSMIALPASDFSEGALTTIPQTYLRLFDQSIGKTLGPRYLLSVSRGEEKDGPKLPRGSVVIESSNPGVILSQMDSLFVILANAMYYFADAKEPGSQPVQLERIADSTRDVRLLPWGNLMAMRKEFAFLKPLVLAWGVEGEFVAAASSRKVLDQQFDSISAGPNGIDRKENSKGPWRRLSRRNDGVTECGYFEGREWAESFESWLAYLEKNHPQVVSDDWWQIWASSRLAEQSRLGIGLVDAADQPGTAVVTEISARSPVASKLQFDDVIVAAEGRPLDRKDAARSVARRYDQRGENTRFAVTVIRNGKRLNIELTVPPSPDLRRATFKPVSSVRQLIALLKHINSASYMRYKSDPGWLEAEVIVEWSGDEKRAKR